METSEMADTSTPAARRAQDPDHRPPEAPTEIPKASWKAILKRTVREFKEDDLTLLAAALTYYGVLSLFPAMLVLASILGLLGASSTQPLIDNLATLTPGPARDVVTEGIRNLQQASGAAGFAFFAGLLGAVWSASGYVGGFIKASNIIYEVEEGRPFWKLRPLQIAVTVLLVLVAAAITLSIVVTGPLAQRVGDVIGLRDTTVTIWNIAKWPVIALIVSQVIAFLFWVAPNVRQPGYRWVSPRRALLGGPLDHRLGRLRVLRLQLRLLQQDLRQPVRGHRLPHLAVGHQRGDPPGEPR
jgi:membrane protein